MKFPDLRSFLRFLESRGELARVRAEVDPDQEITVIQHRVMARGGPALLFEKVKGSPYRAVKKALETPGPAYIHVLSVCPTGWRSATDLSGRLGRLAVETGVFPLYEVVNGRYHLTVQMPKLRPVKDYLKPQGRFRHLREPDLDLIQRYTEAQYELLLDKCQASYPEFPVPAPEEKEEAKEAE